MKTLYKLLSGLLSINSWTDQ